MLPEIEVPGTAASGDSQDTVTHRAAVASCHMEPNPRELALAEPFHFESVRVRGLPDRDLSLHSFSIRTGEQMIPESHGRSVLRRVGYRIALLDAAPKTGGDQESRREKSGCECVDQKFGGDDANDGRSFQEFSWPGLIEAAHAESWPR